MKSFKYLSAALLLLFLLLGFASPTIAEPRFYNFTWSAHTTGHSTQDGSPVSQGDTTGWGIMRVTPSASQPGGVDVTFTGPGGDGRGVFRAPDASTPTVAAGSIEFPGRTDVATTAGATATLTFPKTFPETNLSTTSQFVINGFIANQGGVNSFWGGASPLVAAIAAPLWEASVSGTVQVRMEAGLSGVPLNYQLVVDNTQVFNQTVSAGSATFAWDTRTATAGQHTLVFGVFATDGTVIDGTSIPVTVSNTAPALAASITSPTANATLGSIVFVNMAVSGAAPGSTTFALSVDNKQVFSGATSGTTLSFPWNTFTVANGSHTLRLDVKDAAGTTAATSQSVTVNNGSLGGILIPRP